MFSRDVKFPSLRPSPFPCSPRRDGLRASPLPHGITPRAFFFARSYALRGTNAHDLGDGLLSLSRSTGIAACEHGWLPRRMLRCCATAHSSAASEQRGSRYCFRSGRFERVPFRCLDVRAGGGARMPGTWPSILQPLPLMPPPYTIYYLPLRVDRRMLPAPLLAAACGMANHHLWPVPNHIRMRGLLRWFVRERRVVPSLT